jgi:hypothetical protein
MRRVVKTEECKHNNLTYSEYRVNWRCVLAETKETREHSNIDLERMHSQEAWTRFLSELGVYSIREDLYVLGNLITNGEAHEVYNRVMHRIDAMHDVEGRG